MYKWLDKQTLSINGDISVGGDGPSSFAAAVM